jgi:A/G-specific adenine glycosylase
VPSDLIARRQILLDWGTDHFRDLPWRRTRDPWRVLVSELMLQQTQAARVVSKYEEFVERYPTPAACARSTRADVVTSWAGLGYNRRAVNLHRCAHVVTEHHGGQVPAEIDDLLRLPGVGPYTARAVLAFAFERDVGIVDTNVGRVLARWEGRPLARREVQRAADAVLAPGRAWSWNQTMLDLGATVCTKRSPDCSRCPANRWCSWYLEGSADPDPADGSAAVSTGQSRFVGSDRQGRGRLVDALRAAGRIPRSNLSVITCWNDDEHRALRVAETLVADGIATWDSHGALMFAVSDQSDTKRRIDSAT